MGAAGRSRSWGTRPPHGDRGRRCRPAHPGWARESIKSPGDQIERSGEFADSHTTFTLVDSGRLRTADPAVDRLGFEPAAVSHRGRTGGTAQGRGDPPHAGRRVGGPTEDARGEAFRDRLSRPRTPGGSPVRSRSAAEAWPPARVHERPWKADSALGGHIVPRRCAAPPATPAVSIAAFLLPPVLWWPLLSDAPLLIATGHHPAIVRGVSLVSASERES